MEQFKKKWILLDTNLLIEILKDDQQYHFKDFLSELRTLEIVPVIDRSVLFEFRRGSRTRSHLNKKNCFLEVLLGAKEKRYYLRSSASEKIVRFAEELAILYSHNDSKNSRISFTDCLVAAQLMMYKDNMCLATLDNNDFPLVVFDRTKVITIDTGQKILTIGIYSFNTSKYKACKRAFEST